MWLYLRQNPTVTEHVNVEAEEKSSESEVLEAKVETLDEHLVRLHSIEEMKGPSQENALRDQLASFMAKCEYETRMTEISESNLAFIVTINANKQNN